MTILKLLAALAAMSAALPAQAGDWQRPAAAPPGTPETRYCMHIEAITGSRIEQVRCWTRAEWADQGVDLDRDWPKEGVRVIG